jgi:hypothetical protein
MSPCLNNFPGLFIIETEQFIVSLLRKQPNVLECRGLDSIEQSAYESLVS